MRFDWPFSKIDSRPDSRRSSSVSMLESFSGMYSPCGHKQATKHVSHVSRQTTIEAAMSRCSVLVLLSTDARRLSRSVDATLGRFRLLFLPKVS